MLYFVIDILGTIAFAISGVIVAMDKRLDLFGVFIIAFVTAVGGGTLRDILLGSTPVIWLQDIVYLYTIVGSVLVAILFRNQLKYVRRSLFLFDTIGIGLGTITASFGGVIRDILCNEIPIIFRKEIYATACILGGLGYFLFKQIPVDNAYPFIGGILMVIGIRFLAVTFKIALPNIYR